MMYDGCDGGVRVPWLSSGIVAIFPSMHCIWSGGLGVWRTGIEDYHLSGVSILTTSFILHSISSHMLLC
jgi:hypothetical protein